MEQRVVIDPTISNGRPIINGTRISAMTILQYLGARDSVEDILEHYDSIDKEDVLACIRYSSKLMSNGYSLKVLESKKLF